MNMQRFQVFFSSALSAICLVAISGVRPSPAFAQNNEVPCNSALPDSYFHGGGICIFPAQTYGTTIYQIAICTSDPLTNATPDTSSCHFLFNNNSGVFVNMGPDGGNYLNPATISSLSSSERPPIGNYPYIYSLFSNRVLIKGSTTVGAGTMYTTNQANPALDGEGALASTDASQYAAFDSPIARDTSEDDRYPYTFKCFLKEGGSGTSMLTANNQPTSMGANDKCVGVARLASSDKTVDILGRLLSVTPDVTGLELKFATTQALALYSTGYYGGILRYVIDFNGFDMELDFTNN